VKKPDARKIKEFQKKIFDHYKKEGRHDLPWRKTKDPYKVLVSEVMLQQTQVDRVVPKYREFLKAFPNMVSLSDAANAEVLRLWSGLGYNRRALYLKRAAEAVASSFGGKFPADPDVLETLPGVGPYTARAVATFSRGGSYIFIETNIRRVFIHAFFSRSAAVPDKDIIPLIRQTLPKASRTREWYWALMDYGSSLKKMTANPNRRSAHYAKQSAFKGSLRELRGKILRQCMTARLTERAIIAGYGPKDRVRAKKALESLVRDGFLVIGPGGYVKIS